MLEDDLYRIVNIENGIIKLNKNTLIGGESAPNKKKFSTSAIYGSGTSDEYWDYYLNNTWYNELELNNMMEKGIFYNKSMTGGSYKNSICNIDNTTETTKNCEKTTSIWNSGYVGLPRYGEMFASIQKNGYSAGKITLITPSNSSNVWHINSNAAGSNDITTDVYARPSIFLKSNVVITGGDGTKSNPFTIALK